jgi:hypothetical protein
MTTRRNLKRLTSPTSPKAARVPTIGNNGRAYPGCTGHRAGVTAYPSCAKATRRLGEIADADFREIGA